jgi:outer membrane protein
MRTLILGCCLLTGTFAQTTTLTLQEAQDIALQNNPQLSAAKYNAAAAQNVPLEVHSTLLPSLSGAITGVAADSGTRLAAGALNNPVVYNRLGTGLSLTQTVTDFGRTHSLQESANLRAQAQDQVTETTRANILIAVARAYFSVLRSKAVLQVAQQTVDARKLVSDQVTALANNNLKSNLDVSFANVNLSDAQLLLSQAQNNVKAAEADLSAAIGLPAPTEYTLREEPEPGEVSNDVTTWIEAAMRDRPELKDLRLQQRAAGEFAKAEHALKYPTVSIAGTAGFAPAAESTVKPRYGAIGVNLSIPIFNGGLFKFRESEAQLKAMAATENVNDLANRITRDVKVAFLNAQTARERVGLTAQMLQRSQLALDLARGRYDLGLSSIVELSQAQLNLTVAQIDSASARYDYQALRAVLDYQAGAIR